jgi:hypothetical protein
MPTLKARIFSNHPEDANSLAEALKQQGYVVEVLRPEATSGPGTDLDLEIVLETCDRGDVVPRAAELAQEFHADVAVSPGTLMGTPAYQELDFSLDAAPDPIQATTNSNLHSHPEAALHASPETYTRPPEEIPATQVATRESEVIHPDNAVRGFLSRAIPKIAVTLTAWAESAREGVDAARAQTREYREQALTGIAQVRASREERLLELTQRRIEAQEYAARLVTARKNAAVYLEQLQRENGGVIRPANPELPEHESGAEVVRPWRVLFESFLERARGLRWDAVLAGIASAGALFAIGLAVASFTKPDVTPASEPPAAATSTPTAAPAQPSPAATKPSAATTSHAARARSRKPSPAQHTKAARNRTDTSSDEGGNDVVVRHLVSPSPTPKVQAQRWRHFSDMDH